MRISLPTLILEGINILESVLQLLSDFPVQRVQERNNKIERGNLWSTITADKKKKNTIMIARSARKPSDIDDPENRLLKIARSCARSYLSFNQRSNEIFDGHTDFSRRIKCKMKRETKKLFFLKLNYFIKKKKKTSYNFQSTTVCSPKEEWFPSYSKRSSYHYCSKQKIRSTQ